ncbi:MAG TPA: ABC transporter permease [Planctomycetota bacterium]|nr:ABC transporter permease [Planctomycetota bacterium]
MALLPIGYSVRSLLRRRTATVLTVLSIGATVAVLAGMGCLRQGFTAMVTERGRTDLAVFLRPGATSEGESGFPRESVDLLVKETAEVAVDGEGRPLAAGEMFLAVRRRKVDGGETNVAIRGVEPQTFAIHGDDVRIVEGRKFDPGADEVIVGRSLSERIQDCRVGDVLVLNTTPFRVVGVMEARGAFDSEIWGDVRRMQHALQRPILSRVIAVLKPGSDVAAIAARWQDDPRVQAAVYTERDYLENQTRQLSATLAVVGGFLVVVMGIAAAFTGVNAMLAAVAARVHEIGILRALGFGRAAVFFAFLFEALALGLLGGLVGCLLVVPLHGVRTGTTNFDTFSEVAFSFRLTPEVVGQALVFSLVLGLLGGTLPAWRACRMRPTQALRRG